mgnify:CR=1 FL=1
MNKRPGRKAGPQFPLKTMTSLEKSLRDAAAKADTWAEKAEKAEQAGRLEDAATLCTLAAAAKEKADRLAQSEAALPPVCRGDSVPDASTACSICGAPGIRSHAGLMLACTNPECIRYGSAVAATVF